MRSLIVITILALVAVVVASVTRADPRPGAGGRIAVVPNQVRGDEITAALKAAAERGLEFLALRQHQNGSFGEGNGQSGITSLAALGFMQAGNLPNRGRYGRQVARALDFVLDSCQESGLIA